MLAPVTDWVFRQAQVGVGKHAVGVARHWYEVVLPTGPPDISWQYCAFFWQSSVGPHMKHGAGAASFPTQWPP